MRAHALDLSQTSVERMTLSSKSEVREARGDKGLFAKEPMKTGELVWADDPPEATGCPTDRDSFAPGSSTAEHAWWVVIISCAGRTALRSTRHDQQASWPRTVE